MIKINLLPIRAAKKKETARQQASIAVLALAGALILIGYSYYDISSRVAAINAKIASTKAELEKTKALIGEVSKIKEVKKVLEDKLAVIDSLKKAKVGPVKMLDELSKVTPEKLWVSSFKQKGIDITIEGISISNEIIAEFMTALDRSSQFKDIDLVVTEQVEQKGMKLKKFILIGRLEGVEPPKPDVKVPQKKG